MVGFYRRREKYSNFAEGKNYNTKLTTFLITLQSCTLSFLSKRKFSIWKQSVLNRMSMCSKQSVAAKDNKIIKEDYSKMKF